MNEKNKSKRKIHYKYCLIVGIWLIKRFGLEIILDRSFWSSLTQLEN